MILDKDGKIGGKVNIIDIFTIIIILIAVLGISVRFFSSPSKSAKERVKLTYVVEIEGVRKYTADAMGKMGVVIEPKQKCKIGEITDVEYYPQKLEEFDANGNVVYAEVPNKYSLEVTISSEGKESENGYYVGNDTELAVGSKISLATKYANSSGKVISIKKID